MPIAWFLAPYERTVGTHLPGRRCALEQFSSDIEADGGGWAVEECLGNFGVVKVNASTTILQAINQSPGFQRIPVALLDDPLSSLNQAQKNAIRNKVQALGFTANEITAALGNDLGNITLGQLLRFVLSRRFSPRYDQLTDTIVLDGAQELPLPPEAIDSQVL